MPNTSRYLTPDLIKTNFNFLDACRSFSRVFPPHTLSKAQFGFYFTKFFGIPTIPIAYVATRDRVTSVRRYTLSQLDLQ